MARKPSECMNQANTKKFIHINHLLIPISHFQPKICKRNRLKRPLTIKNVNFGDT